MVSEMFDGGDDVRGFYGGSGGYKLYGESDTRWYFNLWIELPESVFDSLEGKILYNWITWADEDNSYDTSGAIACKIVVGDQYQTQVDQWQGYTNMDNDSEEVAGKKWYKQNQETKFVKSTSGDLEEGEYFALFWEDKFALQESERPGYKIQQCEVEVIVD